MRYTGAASITGEHIHQIPAKIIPAKITLAKNPLAKNPRMMTFAFGTRLLQALED